MQTSRIFPDRVAECTSMRVDQGKKNKRPKSSRGENAFQGKQAPQWEGGGRKACLVTPDLSYDYRKKSQNKAKTINGTCVTKEEKRVRKTSLGLGRETVPKTKVDCRSYRAV